MVKFSKSIVAGLSLGLLCGGAQASSDTTLGVSGYLSPSSCDVTLGLTDGSLDFGLVASGGLDKDKTTFLDAKQFQVTVACSSPTAVGMKLVDARQSSAVPTISFDKTMVYGLGFSSDGTKIGGYEAAFSGMKDVGQDVTAIYSNALGGWTKEAFFTFTHDRLISAATETTGPFAPRKILHLEFMTALKPGIAHDQGLTFNDDIVLDGSAAFELTYL